MRPLWLGRLQPVLGHASPQGVDARLIGLAKANVEVIGIGVFLGRIRVRIMPRPSPMTTNFSRPPGKDACRNRFPKTPLSRWRPRPSGEGGLAPWRDLAGSSKIDLTRPLLRLETSSLPRRVRQLCATAGTLLPRSYAGCGGSVSSTNFQPCVTGIVTAPSKEGAFYRFLSTCYADAKKTRLLLKNNYK